MFLLSAVISEGAAASRFDDTLLDESELLEVFPEFEEIFREIHEEGKIAVEVRISGWAFLSSYRLLDDIDARGSYLSTQTKLCSAISDNNVYLDGYDNDAPPIGDSFFVGKLRLYRLEVTDEDTCAISWSRRAEPYDRNRFQGRGGLVEQEIPDTDFVYSTFVDPEGRVFRMTAYQKFNRRWRHWYATGGPLASGPEPIFFSISFLD